MIRKARWRNVNLVTPRGVLARDLLIDGDRIAGIVPHDTATGADRQEQDGQGGFLFPGIIDLLQNGLRDKAYAGAANGLVPSASEAMLACGCTGFAPSFGCMPPDALDHTLAALAAQIPQARGARVLGLHSEGPCFALTGAHDPASLDTPSAALADRMVAAADGRLLATTVAPELPGAREFIRAMKAAGVPVHMGHTDAEPERVPEYVGWGIDAVTHMFDVMPQKPADGSGVHVMNLTDSLLAEPGLPLGLICDGIHADARLVQLLAQLGPDRVFLETDAYVNDTGSDLRFEPRPGHFVTSRPGEAVRDDAGGLNGGSLRPDEGLRNYLAMGDGDLVRAAQAAALVPARVIGRVHDLGSIERGKLADLVLLDPATFAVRATMVGGDILYRSEAGTSA